MFLVHWDKMMNVSLNVCYGSLILGRSGYFRKIKRIIVELAIACKKGQFTWIKSSSNVKPLSVTERGNIFHDIDKSVTNKDC